MVTNSDNNNASETNETNSDNDSVASHGEIESSKQCEYEQN